MKQSVVAFVRESMAENQIRRIAKRKSPSDFVKNHDLKHDKFCKMVELVAAIKSESVPFVRLGLRELYKACKQINAETLKIFVLMPVIWYVTRSL